MHQIRFRLGLRPRPRWRSLQRSPDPQLDLRGLLLTEGEGKGGTGGEGTEGEGPSCLSVAPWLRKLDPPLKISDTFSMDRDV